MLLDIGSCDVIIMDMSVIQYIMNQGEKYNELKMCVVEN